MASKSWIKSVNRGANGMLEIKGKCFCCSKDVSFVVPENGWHAWLGGELIQRAMPDASAAEREFLISGMSAECFDRIFSPE
jgi:hypothetical protein